MNNPVNDMPTPVCGSTNRLDKAKRAKKIYKFSGKCTGCLVIAEIKDQTEEEKTPNGCEGESGHTQVYITQNWNKQKRRKVPNGCHEVIII